MKNKELGLLEKAKNIKVLRIINRSFNHIPVDEKLDLLFAWAKDEITAKQVSEVLGITVNSGNYLYRLAVFFKEGVSEGKIIRK